MSKLVLLEKIEACREEMVALYHHHELTSDIIISASCRLDELINYYQNFDQIELQSVQFLN